jgi:hypothetical protein
MDDDVAARPAFKPMSPEEASKADFGVEGFLERLRAAGEASPTAARILAKAGPKQPTVDVARPGVAALSDVRPLSAPAVANEQEGTVTRASVPQESPPTSAAGDAEFAAAQGQSRDMRLAAALGRAGAMANEAISGARFDRGAYDGMEASANAPVAELLARREADKRKRLEDPTSPESRRFQQGVSKALGGVYSPEEIAEMTAADEPFVARYGEMRNRIDERREAATQADLTRRAGMEREDAQRADEQGFRASEAEKDRALQRELARNRGGVGGGGGRAAAMAANVLERDVQKAGEDLEGAGILKGDLDYLDQQAALEDVPGVGKWDSLKTGLLSVFASDDDTRTLQTKRGVVGRLLKERSGTAASDAEVERVMTELGMGPSASEQEFRVGLKRLRNDVGRALATKQARYRPEVVETYRQRGGTLASDIAATPTAGGERKQYSASRNMTRVLDARGNVLRMEQGDTRGR